MAPLSSKMATSCSAVLSGVFAVVSMRICECWEGSYDESMPVKFLS